MPILNEAGLAQISPSNTAVGLTRSWPGADRGEPARYRPRGIRTYFRLMPNDRVRLFTSAVVRKAPRSLGAHVKSLNYLDAIVAKQQAGELGMHDAVMLDSLGAVAECTGANLFLITGETLVTPTTRAALPGITRRTVLELAAELGVEAVERDVWPAELHCADGAFVCGSGAGIVPVGSFDGRPVTHPEHPFVARLQEGYRARTRDPAYRTELSVALN